MKPGLDSPQNSHTEARFQFLLDGWLRLSLYFVVILLCFLISKSTHPEGSPLPTLCLLNVVFVVNIVSGRELARIRLPGAGTELPFLRS